MHSNAQAAADARAAGVGSLVGINLLRDYREIGPMRWQGRVYVPDMNREFLSTMQLLDAGHLKISGCVLRGLVCKSQIWERAG